MKTIILGYDRKMNLRKIFTRQEFNEYILKSDMPPELKRRMISADISEEYQSLNIEDLFFSEMRRPLFYLNPGKDVKLIKNRLTALFNFNSGSKWAKTDKLEKIERDSYLFSRTEGSKTYATFYHSCLTGFKLTEVNVSNIFL